MLSYHIILTAARIKVRERLKRTCLTIVGAKSVTNASSDGEWIVSILCVIY